MTTFVGKITAIEITDSSKTATVKTNPADTFKVTNDNDSSFGAMVSVLVAAKGAPGNVTIEHSGAKEINKLTF